MHRIAVLLLILLPASQIDAAALPRTIDREVRETMRRFEIPGLAIAVVQNDRPMLVRGYGILESGGSSPVTADTLFELGSTSKAFTTAAMAVLVSEGTMKWDDPVRKYLPGFRLADPCSDSLVTLRDTVSHRTGLSRHDELWEATDWSRAELVRAAGLLTPEKPLRSAYQYNNIMFVVAGEAVGAAAGTSWDEFMRTRLFGPLGMSRSGTTVADWNAAAHATGHSWDGSAHRATPRRLIDYSAIGPAGTVKTTANDMARWLRFQLSGGVIDGRRVVSSEALAETWKPHAIVPFEGVTAEANPESNLSAYALGWNILDYRGELLVAHAGVLNGFRSNIALLPGQNAGIAILENVGRGYALFALRNTILDAFLNSPSRDWNAFFLQLEKRLDAREEAKRKERAARSTAPARDPDAYAGTWHHPAYGDVSVVRGAEGLTLQWEQLNAQLMPQGGDLFYVTVDEFDVDTDVRFSGTNEGVTTMTLFGQQFIRADPGAPSS